MSHFKLNHSCTCLHEAQDVPSATDKDRFWRIRLFSLPGIPKPGTFLMTPGALSDSSLVFGSSVVGDMISTSVNHLKKLELTGQNFISNQNNMKLAHCDHVNTTQIIQNKQ